MSVTLQQLRIWPRDNLLCLGKNSFLSISNRRALGFKSTQLPSAHVSFNCTRTLKKKKKCRKSSLKSKMNLNKTRVEQQTRYSHCRVLPLTPAVGLHFPTAASVGGDASLPGWAGGWEFGHPVLTNMLCRYCNLPSQENRQICLTKDSPESTCPQTKMILSPKPVWKVQFVPVTEFY